MSSGWTAAPPRCPYAPGQEYNSRVIVESQSDVTVVFAFRIITASVPV